MRRRDFIVGLSNAAVCPLAARAQQNTLPAVGFLGAARPNYSVGMVKGFVEGLRELGYVDGRKVTIEYRWHTDYDQLQYMAADLVQRRVAVIATTVSNAAALAAKSATNTTPILFAVGADPVKMGLVASLNRPNGNLTGVTILATETIGKMIAVLHEAANKPRGIAGLINPANPDTNSVIKAAQDAAYDLQIDLRFLTASSEQEVESAFANMASMGVGGAFIEGDAFFAGLWEKLALLAERYALPTIYPTRNYPDVGGLMSYGASLEDAMRILGNYAGRILQGESPANLPVQQATRIELVLNLKTARTLKLTVPSIILALANEVIE